EGLVAQTLLEVRDLGERALESAVLEHDARMADERLEEPLVVGVEGDNLSRPVSDDEDPERPVLVSERRHDPVGKPTGAEIAVEGWRRRAEREQDGAPDLLQRSLHLEVAGVGSIDMGGARPERPEGAPEPRPAVRGEEEDLGVLGPDETANGHQELVHGEREL